MRTNLNVALQAGALLAVAALRFTAPGWFLIILIVTVVGPALLALPTVLSLIVLGLAVSLFPNIVPFEIDIWEAAARDNALVLMLVGAGIMLPIILIYTGYVYSLFWGKVDPDEAYHD